MFESPVHQETFEKLHSILFAQDARVNHRVVELEPGRRSVRHGPYR